MCVYNVLPDFIVEIPSTTNMVVIPTDVSIFPNGIRRLKFGRFKHFTVEYLDFYVTFECNRNACIDFDRFVFFL